MKTLNLLLVFCISINLFSQIPGCTDSQAMNYNNIATENDGSCLYTETQATPTLSIDIPVTLHETSGLITWNNNIWTHNDSNDTNIYSLNSTTGNINETINITGILNTDWEEISQDNNYVYIGNFGNNENGNRADLAILKVDKQSILDNNPTFETIHFSYEDQTNFDPVSGNSTDFDCEAMIINHENIFLFNKQWITKQTSLYSIPKTPGNQTAIKISTLNVNGLITGATFIEDKKLIALCGYSSTIQPFIYLLYDFKGTDFFSGNKRKININLPFHQIEGITTTDGLTYTISNEAFANLPFINTTQKIHTIDLSVYLKDYLNGDETLNNLTYTNSKIRLYPNPSSDFIIVDSALSTTYQINDMLGNTIDKGIINQQKTIDIRAFPNGVYYLSLNNHQQTFKFLKR